MLSKLPAFFSGAGAAKAGGETRASKKRAALGDISNTAIAQAPAKTRRSTAAATVAAAAAEIVVVVDDEPAAPVVAAAEVVPPSLPPAVVDIYAGPEAHGYRELVGDFFAYLRQLEVRYLCFAAGRVSRARLAPLRAAVMAMLRLACFSLLPAWPPWL